MTETTPTPTILLALDTADGARASSQLEQRIDFLWTLNRHKRTDPLEYVVDGSPVIYLTAALNAEPASIPFLAAVRSANASHEIRVLDEDTRWRGPAAAKPPLADLARASSVPAPSEEHPWIYVRGAGWWDGPWTISAGRATDTEGTVVFLEHIAAWSDVPLEAAGRLPGSTSTLYAVES